MNFSGCKGMANCKNLQYLKTRVLNPVLPLIYSKQANHKSVLVRRPLELYSRIDRNYFVCGYSK